MVRDSWGDDAWTDEPESTTPTRATTREPVTENPVRSWAVIAGFVAFLVGTGLYALSRHGPLDIAAAVLFFVAALGTLIGLLRARIRKKTPRSR
jgi:heme A synthase